MHRPALRCLGTWLLLLTCWLLPVRALAGYGGTYTLASGTTRLTLVLQEGAGGQVTGTLSSTTGAAFRLAGRVQEDVVAGTCEGQAGTSQFEASFEGPTLILTLIETDAGGGVTSRSLEFARSGGGAGVTAQLGLETPSAGTAPPAPAGAARAGTPAAGKATRFPELGVAFVPPPDWNPQVQEGVILFTSTRYKGFILVQPHEYASLDQMAADAVQGIVDEASSVWLMPTSALQPVGTNGLSAEFAGIAQGLQARAYVIGLLSPRGGGVTIMASVESASWSDAYPDAARAIAGSLSFSAPAAPAAPAATPATSGRTDTSLMQYLAGEWYSYSSGTTLYGSAGTERTMTLCPDGTYRDSSEFSASGSGDASGSGVDWGAARTAAGQARWTVQGDRTQGVIVVTYPSGQTRRIPYRVVSKAEQTIAFDGITYAFAGTPRCP